MKSRFTTVFATLTLLLATAAAFGQALSNPKFPANANGRVMADEFGRWYLQSQTGISSGAQTVTLNTCYVKVGTANEEVYPIALNTPLLITDGANTETVTPTAVTLPTLQTGVSTISPYNCSFTATFANSHLNPGFGVSAGDGGLEAAINYAIAKGIGVVTVEQSSYITNAMLTAALVYPTVQIEDLRATQLQYWNPQPSTLSVISAPVPRVASASGGTATGCTGTTTVCDGTAVGTWTNAAQYVCVTYVDIMGGESACSTTAHYTSAGSLAINFVAPAASTGAVGWRAYIGLAYLTTAYQIPITAANCTLTTLETTLPACAVTNTLYGQVGSNGIFPTPTVHTSLVPQSGGVAAAYNPNPISHQSFAYAPTVHPYPGFEQSYNSFPATVALTAGQLGVLGSFTLPPAELNYLGQTIVIRGKVAGTMTTGGSAFEIDASIGDITDFTTGTPNVACKELVTATVAAAANSINFECRLNTNAIGTTGSLMPSGHLEWNVTAGSATTGNTATAEESTAALTADVLDPDTIFIVFKQTSAAETAGMQLLDLHVDVL